MLFSTPDEDRLAVFNPLAFTRTDVAEVAVAGPGPYVVTDVATGLEVPAQVVERGGARFLQFLARNVPSLGYKVFSYEPGTPASFPPAATVTPGTRTIESSDYRVRLGDRGQIVEAVHKAPAPDVQLAGAGGLDDFGTGAIQSVVAENVGPVSATLRVALGSPSRTVRVTLYAEVDRIDIENTITQNLSGFRTYRFHANLPGAQIRFEEVGAIARPGMVTQGGDFLPGTRASRMTLNHFVDFGQPDYHLVLSNWDAYAMKLNDSTDSSFDLTGDTVHVVVMEQGLGAGTADQGGDSFFLNRFALRGVAGAFDAAEAMRTALAHQNPLHVIPLPRNQDGPLDRTLGRPAHDRRRRRRGHRLQARRGPVAGLRRPAVGARRRAHRGRDRRLGDGDPQGVAELADRDRHRPGPDGRRRRRRPRSTRTRSRPSGSATTWSSGPTWTTATSPSGPPSLINL